jgi:hypothetical protein
MNAVAAFGMAHPHLVHVSVLLDNVFALQTGSTFIAGEYTTDILTIHSYIAEPIHT